MKELFFMISEKIDRVEANLRIVSDAQIALTQALTQAKEDKEQNRIELAAINLEIKSLKEQQLTCPARIAYQSNRKNISHYASFFAMLVAISALIASLKNIITQ